jgi:hypothetical protein
MNKIFLKVCATIFLIAMAIGCTDKILSLFNFKSDLAVTLGILGMFADAFVIMWFLRLIWEPKKEKNDEEVKSS